MGVTPPSHVFADDGRYGALFACALDKVVRWNLGWRGEPIDDGWFRFPLGFFASTKIEHEKSADEKVAEALYAASAEFEAARRISDARNREIIEDSQKGAAAEKGASVGFAPDARGDETTSGASEPLSVSEYRRWIAELRNFLAYEVQGTLIAWRLRQGAPVEGAAAEERLRRLVDGASASEERAREFVEALVGQRQVERFLALTDLARAHPLPPVLRGPLRDRLVSQISDLSDPSFPTDTHCPWLDVWLRAVGGKGVGPDVLSTTCQACSERLPSETWRGCEL